MHSITCNGLRNQLKLVLLYVSTYPYLPLLLLVKICELSLKFRGRIASGVCHHNRSSRIGFYSFLNYKKKNWLDWNQRILAYDHKNK